MLGGCADDDTPLPSPSESVSSRTRRLDMVREKLRGLEWW